MASGNTLAVFHPTSISVPSWSRVSFTSGSTEPTPGTVLYGDTSAAYATVEFVYLTSGTWGGGDAAGFLFLSSSSGTWTSSENATGGADSVSNHLTLTSTPSLVVHAVVDFVNGTPVLLFDDTVAEYAVFTGYMPRHYAGGGLTLTLGWMGNTQTSGDAFWGVAFKSVTDDADDLDVKNFAAINTGAATTASVAGEVDYYTGITFTDGADMDSVAAGEYFQMLVVRLSPNTTDDTMTGDAQLVFVEIKET